MNREPSLEKEWMKAIPEEARRTMRLAGFGQRMGMGERPALLVIDVTYGFTGSESLTLEEAIREFPTACGPVSWKTMPKIERLIGLCRSASIPIVFTRSSPDDQPYAGNATKSNRSTWELPRFNEFPPPVRPEEGEWILEKTKASAFFQTPLQAYLVKRKVDTLIVCGVSTSGCVRATAVDGFSHGYSVLVVDDCCFDRSYYAHCANLFDLSSKYATVLSLHELEEWIAVPKT